MVCPSFTAVHSSNRAPACSDPSPSPPPPPSLGARTPATQHRYTPLAVPIHPSIYRASKLPAPSSQLHRQHLPPLLPGTAWEGTPSSLLSTCVSLPRILWQAIVFACAVVLELPSCCVAVFRRTACSKSSSPASTFSAISSAEVRPPHLSTTFHSCNADTPSAPWLKSNTRLSRNSACGPSHAALQLPQHLASPEASFVSPDSHALLHIPVRPVPADPSLHSF